MAGVPPSPKRSALAKTLGRNMARVRYERKLTQEKLAELVDIHERHYQKIEAGHVSASFPIIVRIRKALKCPWDRLLDGIE